jgi:predicted lactoylglutathione lyase
MIDHFSIQVLDYEKSKQFYLKALGPLGYAVCMELTREKVPSLPSPKVCGLGEKGKPDFWLSGAPTPTTPQHMAFRAEKRALVDEFFKAAIAAGAKSNGEPGVRAHYHPKYYGAFVIDLNGHNLEAVCHEEIALSFEAARTASLNEICEDFSPRASAPEEVSRSRRKSRSKSLTGGSAARRSMSRFGIRRGPGSRT